MQSTLDQKKLLRDMINSARYIKNYHGSTGGLGVTGFCWGGSTTNLVAVRLGAVVQAAAPFYGSAPDPKDVKRIRADMLMHYAENDKRVNATRAGYEAALKEAGTSYEAHTYKGTGHGFHNNTTPRLRRGGGQPGLATHDGLVPQACSSCAQTLDQIALFSNE